MFNSKILCVGNNSESTDALTTELAESDSTVNHGLIDNADRTIDALGYYHTSVADLSSGEIVKIARQFDTVMMLDQAANEWSHAKLLMTTYRLMCELESLGVDTVFRDNANIQSLQHFSEFLRTNKSFCIYPWIDMVEINDTLYPCARSGYKITTRQELTSWRDDEKYQSLRQRMLKGERLYGICDACYKYEDDGVESYREYETVEWCNKLDISSVEDLNKITHPHYYELRLSNECNISCRGCVPWHSSRIETEYKKFNIVVEQKPAPYYSSLDIIDRSTLDSDVRVYLTGGEPTVMTEVYKFMQECIDLGKTDFEFTLGTNAAHLSKRFLRLSEHFTNMNFSISIDGYDKINDYWRWGSDWSTVIANTKLLQSQGHSISINTVPGIYNAANMHTLFEFLDREFPNCGLYLQLNYFEENSVFNYPDHAAVIESLDRCKRTNAYYTNGKSVKSTIDQMYDHYSSNPVCDLNALKKFYEFNDRLDHIRNCRLADYIPELDACRRFVQKT